MTKQGKQSIWTDNRLQTEHSYFCMTKSWKQSMVSKQKSGHSRRTGI